ncbi:MAG: hypothetical protein IPK58_22345 [Acidobacteria bacterium]|nr:hypothetical protein [Acidobacteriota bacterium]
MAYSVSFNVANDALQAEGRNAFAEIYAWAGATIPDPNNPGQTIPNPVGTTKAQFVDFKLKQFYKEVIRAARRKTAAAAIVVTPVGD